MSPEPGRILLHYRLTDKIGEGGMGAVWRAVDTNLDREVAIKILPDGLAADPSRLERFEREAKAIAALNHPGIVTIHSIEQSDEHRFLVMELVDGESLDRKIPPRGVPLAELFDLAIPLAEALAAAHDKGIVHRDVKPANVMVARDGTVKVLDFGLAKLSAEEGAGTDGATQAATRPAELTEEGVVMGTAPYMSPEQLNGREVDRRSDIFSLGVLLYEMAAGRRPFTGESRLELASSILKDAPPPVDEQRAELPRHLGRIIEHCLEKKPDHRFQTARDVRNQLVSLRRETTSGIAVPEIPARRGGSRAWLAAAVAALVLIAGSIAAWQTLAPGTTPDAAAPAPASAGMEGRKSVVVLPFENLGSPDDEYFAAGMTEEVRTRLTSLDGLAVISRSSAMRYKRDRPPLRQIGEELGVDYVLEGTVRWQRSPDGTSRVLVTPTLIQVSDDTHLWAERYEAVLADIFGVQSDIATRVSEALGVALLDRHRRTLKAIPTENLEAYDLFLRASDHLQRGRELQAAEPIRTSIQGFEWAIELDPEFALAYARLSVAHSYLHEQRMDHSPERIAAAERAARRAMELDPELPDSHYALGMVHFAGERDRDHALTEFQVALAGRPSSAEAHEAVSLVQIDLGQWEAARASMRTALRLNPKAGRLACWTGGRAFGLRDFEDALEMHEEAIRLSPRRSCPYFCKANIYLNSDGDTARTREFLASLPPGLGLEEQPPINYPWVMADLIDGRYEDALQRMDSGTAHAYDWRLHYLPKDLLRAKIDLLMGREDRAPALYEAARAHLEALLEDRPEDERFHSSLGVALAGLGRAQEAIRAGERGLELIEGGQDESLGMRLYLLAEIHAMLGDPDRAIAYLDQLLSTPAHFAAPFIAVDPTFQDLHDDPRFATMIERHRTIMERARLGSPDLAHP